MDGRGRKGDGRIKFSLFIITVDIYNTTYNLLCGVRANDNKLSIFIRFN